MFFHVYFKTWKMLFINNDNEDYLLEMRRMHIIQYLIMYFIEYVMYDIYNQDAKTVIMYLNTNENEI